MVERTDASPLEALARRVRSASVSLPFASPVGAVSSVLTSSIVVEGLSRWLKLGSLVEVRVAHGYELAEVVRLERDHAVCKAFETRSAIGLGDPVHPARDQVYYPHDSWKGRIINALGRPMDGAGELETGTSPVRLHTAPPGSMARQLVGQQVKTGIRVLDTFTPVCMGQRIGIFAGSGVGKSSLVSMIANTGAFDVTVISLVGERGREVREFVDLTLGGSADRAVTVVSTGDESAMMRRMAPQLATAIAEYFRDQRRNVLLIMDSVTRFAHACRDVALSAGEPPVARGFPPSVFSQLPQLLERAGPGEIGKGMITAFYTVLVDGDDHNDPVADAVRGMLDGHIVLDRSIAAEGRYPAVDLLNSLSRLAHRAWTPDQQKAVGELRRLVSRFEDSRDLRAMGGYASGSDPELDKAIEVVPKLYGVLSQRLDEAPSADGFREIANAIV